MNENEIQILREEIDILKAKLSKLSEGKSHDKKIAAMDMRLDKLEKRIDRSTKTSLRFEETVVRAIEMIKGENADAFERIKNIELKFFPNLASDLDQLHGVIGDTGPQQECPHERRKR